MDAGMRAGIEAYLRCAEVRDKAAEAEQTPEDFRVTSAATDDVLEAVLDLDLAWILRDYLRITTDAATSVRLSTCEAEEVLETCRETIASIEREEPDAESGADDLLRSAIASLEAQL